MSDYNKQTVAQLRVLLKERGIPATGLTRKAQIVEKLEEADAAGAGEGAGAEAPEASDATPDAQDEEAVTSLPLAEAGEPAQVAHEESPPVPAPTADGEPETVSHIDSEVPPPDQTKAIEETAEDATMEEEAGGPQPTEVFRAAPADAEDVVGPKITEPTDEEMEVEGKDMKDGTADDTQDTLPDAPGPAAEAARLTQQPPEILEDAADTDVAMHIDTPSPAINEEPSVEKAELLPIPERSTAETSRLNTEELEADTRKRKRRSDSPDLTVKEITTKKARSSDGVAPEVHLKEDSDVDTDMIRDSNSARQEKKENTARYKDLVQPDASVVKDALPDDDRPTIPALHPVTSALYIRNLMRPLRPEPLRTHLASLASPPAGTPDPALITTLFLDAMKTHALVLFASHTAASRVRAALHGAIWPPEANRKELWVDFVPEELVGGWISEEESVAEREKRATTKWEVVYVDSEEGGVKAVHQAVGSQPAAALSRPTAPAPAPAPTQASAPPAAGDAPFVTLDTLFPSTTQKPQLFYLPVSDAVAESRLASLRAATSRAWNPDEVRRGRGIKHEMKYRYTFEDEESGGGVVECGEDRGPWVGGGGERGGFRGRGGRGGWRGRGGGVGWRG